MRVKKAYALVLAVGLAGRAGRRVSRRIEQRHHGDAADGAAEDDHIARHQHGTSLVIEASDPVPYVATRPDPLTLYIDFRNVGADGLASFVARGKAPIADVAVEPGDRTIGGEPARAHQPVAAGRAPRPRRPQHGRHRLRQGDGEGRRRT